MPKKTKVQKEKKDLTPKNDVVEKESVSEIPDRLDVDPIAPIEPVTEGGSHGQPETKTQTAPAPELLSDHPLPGLKQKLFEAPDGKIFVGPKDAHSIPDPRTGREIRPKREATGLKHRA